MIAEILAESFKNAEHYGLEEVLMQTMEEAAELIQAANKLRRACGAGVPTNIDSVMAYRSVTEEVEDVQIMLDQLRFLLNVDTAWMAEYYEEKVHRTTERRLHGGV